MIKFNLIKAINFAFRSLVSFFFDAFMSIATTRWLAVGPPPVEFEIFLIWLLCVNTTWINEMYDDPSKARILSRFYQLSLPFLLWAFNSDAEKYLDFLFAMWCGEINQKRSKKA